MLTILGIDHIVLRTTNLDAMLMFYCNILGCTIERETSPEVGLTQLRAGNSLIDIVTVESQLGKLGGGSPTMKNNNLDHFCLKIAVKEEAYIISYLNSNGIDTGKFSERYGAQGYGNSIYISDPDENTVELRCQI